MLQWRILGELDNISPIIAPPRFMAFVSLLFLVLIFICKYLVLSLLLVHVDLFLYLFNLHRHGFIVIFICFYCKKTYACFSYYNPYNVLNRFVEETRRRKRNNIVYMSHKIEKISMSIINNLKQDQQDV